MHWNNRSRPYRPHPPHNATFANTHQSFNKPVPQSPIQPSPNKTYEFAKQRDLITDLRSQLTNLKTEFTRLINKPQEENQGPQSSQNILQRYSIDLDDTTKASGTTLRLEKKYTMGHLKSNGAKREDCRDQIRKDIRSESKNSSNPTHEKMEVPQEIHRNNYPIHKIAEEPKKKPIAQTLLRSVGHPPVAQPIKPPLSISNPRPNQSLKNSHIIYQSQEQYKNTSGELNQSKQKIQEITFEISKQHARHEEMMNLKNRQIEELLRKLQISEENNSRLFKQKEEFFSINKLQEERIKKLSEQLKNAMIKSGKVQEKMTEEFKKLQIQLDSQRLSFKQMVAEKENMSGKHHELEEDYKKLSGKYSQLEKKIGQKQKNIESLEKQLKKNEQILVNERNSGKQNIQANTQKEKLQQKLSLYLNNIDKLSQKIKEQKQNNQKLELRCQELEISLKEKQNTVRNVIRDCKGLQKQLNEVRRQKRNLQSLLEETSEQLIQESIKKTNSKYSPEMLREEV